MGNSIVVTIIIKVLLLLFSNYGYASLLRSKLNCNKYLVWIIETSGIIIVLYIASLLGLLYFFGLILPRIGLLLAVYFVIEKWQRNSIVLKKLNIITLSFLAYSLLLGITLLQSRLLHYDNFSHWGLIVKYLFTQQSLPNVHSDIIGFSSYPVGTSLWCYYFVNFIGFNEGVMIFAQFCLIISCLYAMVAVIKDKNNVLTFAIIFLIISLFNYFNTAIRMNNLLVDFVLPLVTLAAISGIFVYKNNMYVLATITVILTGFLGIIKNNGIFFVIIVLLYFLITVLIYKEQYWTVFKKFRLIITTILLSMAPYISWLLHIKYTFGHQISKHEVSVAAYRDIYESKTSEIVSHIIQKFWHHILSLSTLPTQGVILINLLFIVTIISLYMIKHKENRLVSGLLITNVIIILYYIGILLMFIFSMPNKEALSLAGFDRYASSVVIFGLGIYAFFAVRAIDQAFYEQRINMRSFRTFKSFQNKYSYEYASILLLFISTLLILSENNGINYNLYDYQTSIPQKIKQISGNNMTLNHKKYLIISADQEQIDNYFTQYVGKYYLYSDHVDAKEDISQLSRSEFIGLISKFDDVLVIDEHYTFKAMSRKYLNKNIEKGMYTKKFLLDSIAVN